VALEIHGRIWAWVGYISSMNFTVSNIGDTVTPLKNRPVSIGKPIGKDWDWEQAGQLFFTVTGVQPMQ